MDGASQMVTSLSDRVQCPYDPSHTVKFSRFHGHFLKCQQNNPHDKRKPCPYNFSELIDPERLTEHMMVCRYRVNYGPSSNSTQSNSAPKINPPEVEFDPEVEVNETSDYSFDSDPDNIDSVSVIMERRRNRKNTGFSSRSTPTATLVSQPSTNIGRGRAAFIRSIMNLNPCDVKMSPPAVENDGGNKFSFICERNIRGEEPTPINSATSLVTDSTNFINPSNTNSLSKKSQFLLNLKASLNNPASDGELLQKVGKGRGRFLVR